MSSSHDSIPIDKAIEQNDNSASSEHEIKIDQSDSSDHEIHNKSYSESESSESSSSNSKKTGRSQKGKSGHSTSRSKQSIPSQRANQSNSARSKSSQSKSQQHQQEAEEEEEGNSESSSYSKNGQSSEYSKKSIKSKSNVQNAAEKENTEQESYDSGSDSYSGTDSDSDNDSQKLHSIHHDSESPTNECHDLFTNIDPNNMIPEHDLSCRIFQYRSIADSVLRSINMFREASLKPCFQEDDRLYRVAMNHSRKMADGDSPCDTKDIPNQITTYPFVYYCSHVAHYSSMDNAFTNVVNLWTTDIRISKDLLANFNCGGVGVCLSKTDEVYFTLILGLRTTIGYSFYSGTSLHSILLAEKCAKIVNEIRTKDFQLLPIKLDLALCDHAFRFSKMEIKELTPELVSEKIGICSLYRISFAEIKYKDLTPKSVVQNWMNQIGKAKTILGDFNRVGFGFNKKGTQLFSVSIYTRTLHAAVIDGSETIMDGSIIAQQISEILNEFRQQHSLPPMNLDTDLCQAAQEHTEYIANGQEGLNPLDDEFYCTNIETQYEATDISHMCCNEISRAPKAFMAKWRNNVDCISVLLNQVDDVGVGVCFDKDYVCHITIIIASRGTQAQINNIIVKL